MPNIYVTKESLFEGDTMPFKTVIEVNGVTPKEGIAHRTLRGANEYVYGYISAMRDLGTPCSSFTLVLEPSCKKQGYWGGYDWTANKYFD